MPIYAYRCETCGHAQDVLQKMSDAPLSVCPACGAATYKKQVTAAGFQLKGSGWYVTDFRGDGKAPAKPVESGSGEGAKSEAKADAKPDAAGSAAKGDAAPAAPAPAAKAPPAPSAGGAGSPPSSP